MRSSPRRRVTHQTIATLLLLALAYAGFFYWLAHGVLLHEIDENIERLAAPLTEVMHRPRLAPGELKQAIAEYPLFPGDYVALQDRNGRTLAARGDASRLPATLPLGATELSEVPARLVVTPIVVSGQTRAQLVQMRSLGQLRHTLGHVSVGLLGLVPLALLLSLALAVWLAEKAARPVEDALTRERQFSRDVSHELRTPLALILTNTQLLLNRPALDPDTREKLQHVERRARRMKALLQDLLTLGRGDAGLGEEAMRFSLVEVLESEVETVSQRAVERGIRLTVDPVPPEAGVTGSPHLISQVLHNLLDNALHYTPAGGDIRVRLGVSGHRAHVAVTNSGPGIPEADRERVFGRFQRLDQGRESNPDGTGLGLAIARAIARAHRGDLVLNSRPNEGTTFTLSLPLA